MVHIDSKDGVYVASIKHQPCKHRPEEPWALLYRAGRIDRFVSEAEAKREAQKSWPGCRIYVSEALA